MDYILDNSKSKTDYYPSGEGSWMMMGDDDITMVSEDDAGILAFVIKPLLL
jgi:hypothetical protein